MFSGEKSGKKHVILRKSGRNSRKSLYKQWTVLVIEVETVLIIKVYWCRDSLANRGVLMQIQPW